MPTRADRHSCILSGALLGLLAGCAAPGPFGENRLALEAARQQVVAGQYDAATASLEALVVRTNELASECALQRYFAAFLLSRASLERAVRATAADAWLAPLVGTTHYLNFARQWRDAAAASPPASADGEALLPEALAGYGLDHAESYLDLAWLVICARTRFQDEVADVIGRHPELATVEGAEALSQTLDLSDELRPWLLWSLYDHQKTRDEPLAYRFGVRARELGRRVPGAFPPAYGDGIVDWILRESRYTFRSSAGVEFDPGSDVCSQTGEPNITFQSAPK